MPNRPSAGADLFRDFEPNCGEYRPRIPPATDVSPPASGRRERMAAGSTAPRQPSVGGCAAGSGAVACSPSTVVRR